MYRLIVTTIGVAIAIGVALGCGGGEDKATSADKAVTPPLTKDQFIEQAERACSEIAKKREAAAAAWRREHSGEIAQDQLDDVFRKVVGPAIQKQVEAVEALQAPAGDEARIDQMVENLAKAGQEISREGTQGTGAQEFFQFQKQAGNYGLETCARVY